MTAQLRAMLVCAIRAHHASRRSCTQRNPRVQLPATYTNVHSGFESVRIVGHSKAAHASPPPFHLAFPVHDLKMARDFYQGVLGCEEGRSAARCALS
jgi:hypothetical protein